MRNKILPKTLALLTISAITFVPRPANAIEPVTIAAAATLASAVISATSPRSSLPLKLAMAQIEISIALHDRLDNIEDALAHIIKSIDGLPDEIRALLEDDSDRARSETVVGIAKTIQQQIELAESERRDPSRDQLIRPNIINLQNARNALFERSDKTIPTVIQTFVSEIIALKATKQSQASINQVYNSYKKRLSDALDKDRVGSIFWTLNHLIAKHRAHEQQIAKLFFESEPGIPLQIPFKNGTYDWYSYSTIGIRRSDSPESPNEYTFRNVKKQREVLIYYSVMDKSLYRISIKPMNVVSETIEITNPANGTKYHKYKIIYNSDSFEGAITEKQKLIENNIKIFNNRVLAIEDLFLATRLIDAITSYMSQPIKSDAALLNAEVVRWNSPLGTGIALEEKMERQASGNWIVQQMQLGRLKARETIDRNIKGIKSAIEDGNAQAWRSDLLSMLNIIAASAQFANAIEAEAAAARLRATAEVIRSVSAGEDHAQPARPETRGGAPATARQPAPKKVDLEKIKTMPLKDMTPLEKIARTAQLNEYLKNTPSQSSTGKIDSTRMSKIFEALLILDSMNPTLGDKFHVENHKTTAEWIKDIISDGLTELDFKSSLKALLQAALLPSVVSDGGLTAVSTQIFLREQITADLARELYRVTNDSRLNAVELSIKETVTCEHGCFRRSGPATRAAP